MVASLSPTVNSYWSKFGWVDVLLGILHIGVLNIPVEGLYVNKLLASINGVKVPLAELLLNGTE